MDIIRKGYVVITSGNKLLSMEHIWLRLPCVQDAVCKKLCNYFSNYF